MRQILSVSIPRARMNGLKQRAKLRGHRSMSAYIQFLLEEDLNLIPDAELIKTIRDARKEYRLGKSVRAVSMRELL